MWHDPTDWVIANYPWPAGSCTAGGGTEPGRLPSLLRLRPEDVGLGLASPLRGQVLTVPRVDGLQAEQIHTTDQPVDDQHHQHQQQQLCNHDSDLVIDPLVSCQLQPSSCMIDLLLILGLT